MWTSNIYISMAPNLKQMRINTPGYGKNSTEKSRYRLFDKITTLFQEINEELSCTGIKFCINSEYAPEYLKEAAEQYAKAWQMDKTMFVHGRGHRKTTQQRHYEKLSEYAAKLEEYVEKIRICGEDRNSYSKTDHSATFMRIKTDYMGNDQLLPAYNVQVGVADEYIAVVDVNQYRSDMDCFSSADEQILYYIWLLSEVSSSGCRIWFLQQLHLL